jgi:hypothetical protein
VHGVSGWKKVLRVWLIVRETYGDSFDSHIYEAPSHHCKAFWTSVTSGYPLGHGYVHYRTDSLSIPVVATPNHHQKNIRFSMRQRFTGQFRSDTTTLLSLSESIKGRA